MHPSRDLNQTALGADRALLDRQDRAPAAGLHDLEFVEIDQPLPERGAEQLEQLLTGRSADLTGGPEREATMAALADAY